MNIVFLGNCQTLTYAKYFSKLLSVDQVNWVCADCFQGLKPNDMWPTSVNLWGKDVVDNIVVMGSEKKHKLLSECDVVICQVFNEQTSHADNYQVLRKKYGNNKIITISNHHENLNGMLEREALYKIDIRTSSIYTDFPNQAKLLTHNHPNVFVILESIKMICNYLNISFFDSVQYNDHLNGNWYSNRFYHSQENIKRMKECRKNEK